MRQKTYEFILTAVIAITSIVTLVVAEEATEQTVATPVSGKTVILDAGHGGEDRAEQKAVMV